MMPLIRESNLSAAWARAFLAVMRRGVSGISPLSIEVVGLHHDSPDEVPAIRERLDEELTRLDRYDCHTVANTIFPCNIWESSNDRHEFYARYRRMLPRLMRHRENRNGLYFERMIAFGEGPQEGNQLEHLIRIWGEGVRRPTAFVANVFDPARDHTRQRRRGFPCLHHVTFTPLGRGGLGINASYPIQFLFERGYGNYLGLFRLGRFVAHELKRELTQLTCSIGTARLGDVAKTPLEAFAADLRGMLQGQAETTPQAAEAGGGNGHAG
jgi:hypothetical protein